MALAHTVELGNAWLYNVFSSVNKRGQGAGAGDGISSIAARR